MKTLLKYFGCFAKAWEIGIPERTSVRASSEMRFSAPLSDWSATT